MKLRGLLFVGIVLELLILGFVYSDNDGTGEVFRYAARYSGRLSLLVFIITFGVFAFNRNKSSGDTVVRGWAILFAVLHVIHLWFVALNIHLNEIVMVPFKLAGGALAYAMIVVYPFVLHRVRSGWPHLVYFYYVGLVMAVTLLARVQGHFEGAEPGVEHVVGLVVLGSAITVFSAVLWRRKARS